MLPNVKKHTLRHTELLKIPLFSRKESILNGNNHLKQEEQQSSILQIPCLPWKAAGWKAGN